MSIEMTTRVIRLGGLQTANVDDDIVILNITTNSYVALDDIGRRIWELIETPRRVEELCAQLTSEFNGISQQIQADVLSFLNELENEKLVHVVDEET